jgi:AraC-like DNA-binding protein
MQFSFRAMNGQAGLMIEVDSIAGTAAKPGLQGLLNRWPVVCQVEGERAIADFPKLSAFPAFALVTDGPINLRMTGSPAEQLETGDLVIVHEPDGVSFDEVSQDSLPTRTNWRIDAAHSGPSILVVRLECVGTQFSPGLMPKPFVVREARPIDRALRSALVESVRSNAPEAVANAAASAVYLQCISDHLASQPREVQMLAGLFDVEIGPVVAALMESPARDWTVETLADVGGMSRSAFARKFRDLMGVAPIDFLVEIRMWQAARRLKQQTRDLKSIALEAGYQSPAAFSVAFKRWSGETPSDFRRGT